MGLGGASARRQNRCMPPNLPRPDQLTPTAVRAAAQNFLKAGGTPPPGFGQSRVEDVWIDLDDGEGPQGFPPKVILWLATDGALPKGYGYASEGPWRQQLIKLGFPVLPKGKRPGPGRDCRGIDHAPRGQVPDADGGRARSLADDLAQIARRKIGPTTRQRLVDARLGQGQFRKDLEWHWAGACAVTGVTVRQALRASHIVPWADPSADDDMRLNPHNGLLLVATLDALFDQGQISFDNSGTLLVHHDISPAQRTLLGLVDPSRALRNDKGLQAMTEERQKFLKMHRAKHGYPDSAP